MNEDALRRALVENCLELERLRINQGMAGNLSARCGEWMLITPTGVPYDKMTAAMVARMPIEKDYGAWFGPLAPSSEWRMHLDIMRARHDVGAIIHTHAVYATTLSLLHKPIPAVHYMIAAFGGPTVRCTNYAPFGTKELSDLAIEGLADRHGVLLGQHGMLATGGDIREALWRAVELETLAKMYVLALGVGRPYILPDDEVMRTVERFKFYGYHPEKTKVPAPARAVASEPRKERARSQNAKAKRKL
ncbi:MAG: class II aldolase/adducin family protein [Xanthobacteraceae bacterium]